MVLEKDGTLWTLDQHDTYAYINTFASDLLSFHDSHLVGYSNVVHDVDDLSCPGDSRTNPDLLLGLTTSNVLVDDWNEACLVDLCPNRRMLDVAY